jgi:hypothetical protein
MWQHTKHKVNKPNSFIVNSIFFSYSMVAANSSDNEKCENIANCLSIKPVDACIRHNSIFEIKETPRLVVLTYLS